MQSQKQPVQLSQLTGGNTRNDEWTPIIGWPLKRLGHLAEAADHPAFLMKALRTRPLWRQAVYSALAVNAFDDPAKFLNRALAVQSPARALKAMVELLPALSPKQVIRGTFEGPAPHGLAGTLGKLGDAPLTVDAYEALIRWHHPKTRDELRYRYLQRQVELDQDHVDAIRILDDVFLVPAMNGANDIRQAQKLNEQLRVVKRLCSAADDDTLLTDAQSLSGKTLQRAFVMKWLMRADRLAVPFEGDAECRPVGSARELVDVARRFKNCLNKLYVGPVLSGRLAVVEYLPLPALALLKHLSNDNWLVASIHGPGNNPVPSEIEEAVRQKVLSFGGHIHVLHQCDPDIAGVLRSVFGGFGLGMADELYDPVDFDF